jgi:hypothetical protein
MGMALYLALWGLFLPHGLGVEVEVGADGLGQEISNEMNHLKNYHHSDTASIELNKRMESIQHPYIQLIPGLPSAACTAKFRSLSSRKIDMYWDNGSDGVFAATLRPSEVASASSYAGHTFFFTVHKNKSHEITRVTIDPDTVSVTCRFNLSSHHTQTDILSYLRPRLTRK